MVRFHILALVWVVCYSEELCDGDCGVNFVQIDLSKNLRQTETSKWYASRAVDYNRSGQSSAQGPFPLKKPLWEYTVKGLNFHQTPCIDDQHNVYTGSDTTKILSFDQQGQKRWEIDGPSSSCQNPFLYQGVLYTSCRDGHALALSMEDGTTLWMKTYCESISSDTYSMTATEDHLFFPCGAREPYGAPDVVLVSRKTGDLLWRVNVPKFTVNIAPCMLPDSVVFNDEAGGMYSLSLKDGSVIWYTAPVHGPDGATLGGVACSPDGKVFNGFATADWKSGGLSAFDVQTGQRLWTKWVTAPVHNAPAIGRIHTHDREAVIFAMGNPTGGPLGPAVWTNGTVYAVDAQTGDFLWTFEPPAWYGAGAAGSTIEQICMPDLFSGATISQDGTVYINWSAGGITYALRDLNKDGRCELHDSEEVSGFNLGSGATGPPALAEQMLVVNTCHGPRAFSV